MSSVTPIRRWVFVWVGFAAYTFVNLARQGTRTVFASGIGIGASTSLTSDRWPVGADYGSYFQAALSWHESGILDDPTMHWVTNIWPPGMVFLDYIAISLVGDSGRFIFALVLFTTALWATVFTVGFFIIDNRRAQVVYTTTVVLLFLTTPFREWVFGPNFALPTGYALAFMLLAMMVLKHEEPDMADDEAVPTRQSALRLTLIVGPLIALSLLFRVTGLVAVYALAAVAIVVWTMLFGGAALDAIRHRSTRWKGSNPRRFRLAASIPLIITVPLGVALGWTYIVSHEAHPDNFTYTVTVPELKYGAAWRTDADLVEMGADWLLPTSTNWACEIDADTCEEIRRVELASPAPYAGVSDYSTRDYQRAALLAAIRNPVAYLEERLPSAWNYWSSDNAAQAVIFLAAAALAIWLALDRFLRMHDLQALLYLCYVSTATLPMLLILFFYYYFIPIQVGSVFYLVLNQEHVVALVRGRTLPGLRTSRSLRRGRDDEVREREPRPVVAGADVDRIEEERDQRTGVGASRDLSPVPDDDDR